MKTFERRAVIRKRLEAGVAPSKIAKDLNVALSTVYRVRTSTLTRKGDRVGHLPITTRVTRAEKEALERLIRDGFGRSKSDVMRKLIRLGGEFATLSPDEEVFLASCEKHFSRLGGNFNQIANALSVSIRQTGKADPTRDQAEMLRTAADEVAKLREIIRKFSDNHQIKNQTLLEQVKALQVGDNG